MPSIPSNVMQQILTGSAAALLVSFVGVLLLAWFRKPRLQLLAPAATLLSIGVAALAIKLQPAFPPTRSAHWLYIVLVAAMALAPLIARAGPPWLRGVLLVAASAGLCYIFSKHNIRNGAWKGGELVAWLGSAVALTTVFLVSTQRASGLLTGRREVVARTLILQLASFALAFQCGSFGYTTGTPLAISIAAAIGGCGIAQLIRPPDAATARAFALAHCWAIASVALVGAFTSASVDFAAASLLFLVPAAGAACFSTDTWRSVVIACVLAAVAAFIAAAIPMWKDSAGSEESARLLVPGGGEARTPGPLPSTTFA